MKRIVLIVGVLFLITFTTSSFAWFPAEHSCPVCRYKHEYQHLKSDRRDIFESPSTYQNLYWPLEYQYIYLPLADDRSVYSCPKCHLSTYMWDFDSIPKNKIDTLTKFLANIKLDSVYKDYFDIPMTTRLEIAEIVYRILGEDNEFWCKFYRVKGFYYDQEKNIDKAKESRLKSLDFAKLMLSDSTYYEQEKETLFIIAAMNNFVGQKDSSLMYLNKASLLTYANKKWDEEKVKGLDGYLTDLIPRYKKILLK